MIRKKKITDEVIDEVARQIHGFISYSTISTYYTMKKIIEDTNSGKDTSESNDILNRMMITAESLYDDLTDKQKELIRGLALDMIKIFS